MSKIDYRQVNKKYYVYLETETQFLSLTDGGFAAKSDKGAAYVGREYNTESTAKKAVRYYSKKQEQNS